MARPIEFGEEDVGNILSLEHVNLKIPNQDKATLFYLVGLGLTRDPYINVGLNNMWVNVGEQQFHLPTGDPQRIPGRIGLVIPNLEELGARLERVKEPLEDTQFTWNTGEGYVDVRCPWGNLIRCISAGPDFGDTLLGMPYVEFLVREGSAARISRFYEEIFGAPSLLETSNGGHSARVSMGRHQWITFRETPESIFPYDGHHVAIYVKNFSGPYGSLKERNLIFEDVRNHQFRFKDLVDPKTGEKLFELEHEVRSFHHPMYRRPLVNRNPNQIQRSYKRGRDAFNPFRG